MPTVHTVAPGETISSIADQFGFLDFETIWKDPANAELRAKRGDGHVLFPGDQVTIPDRQLRSVQGATTQRHRFVAQQKGLLLRIVLLDEGEKPLADAPCVLDVAGASKELVADADGVIEVQVPRNATRAHLTVDDPKKRFDVRVPLVIGGLDPVEEASGQRERLRNLGYYLVEDDDDDPLALRSAVEEFQCDKEMKVTGECDGATQAKLAEAHGS
jgi:hypothetical protein